MIDFEELKKQAVEAYQNIIKDKKYPHPVNLHQGLFSFLENGRLETAYTRTLAYLLDAKAPHGLGGEILKRLLHYVKGIDYSNQITCYNVYPEFYFDPQKKGRFDIYIEGITDKDKPFIIVIEAKTSSTLGKGQLKKYDAYLKSKKNVTKIYLTVNKENPGNNQWIQMIWGDIAKILVATIEDKIQNESYDFVRYYVSSIYAQLYGHGANYLNIYELLSEKVLYDYAEKVKNANFDFKVFQKYPSAIWMLHAYTPEDSQFYDSYKKCVKNLKEHIDKLFKKNFPRKSIHNPQSWNEYIAIPHNEFLNVGITNRMRVEKGKFYDELWWYCNINFPSLQQKHQRLAVYKAKNIEAQYENTDLNITGHNIIFFAEKFNTDKIPDIDLLKCIAK